MVAVTTSVSASRVGWTSTNRVLASAKTTLLETGPFRLQYASDIDIERVTISRETGIREVIGHLFCGLFSKVDGERVSIIISECLLNLCIKQFHRRVAGSHSRSDEMLLVGDEFRDIVLNGGRDIGQGIEDRAISSSRLEALIGEERYQQHHLVVESIAVPVEVPVERCWRHISEPEEPFERLVLRYEVSDRVEHDIDDCLLYRARVTRDSPACRGQGDRLGILTARDVLALQPGVEFTDVVDLGNLSSVEGFGLYAGDRIVALFKQPEEHQQTNLVVGRGYTTISTISIAAVTAVATIFRRVPVPIVIGCLIIRDGYLVRFLGCGPVRRFVRPLGIRLGP